MSDIVKGYTPGPWKWERVRTSCGFCFRVGPLAISDGKVNHACIYADYPGQMALELAEANARLIAAAPDMATELTTLRGEVERLRAALDDADEALTQFTAFEEDCRAIMGNTNFAIVQERHRKIRAALTQEHPHAD